MLEFCVVESQQAFQNSRIYEYWGNSVAVKLVTGEAADQRRQHGVDRAGQRSQEHPAHHGAAVHDQPAHRHAQALQCTYAPA